MGWYLNRALSNFRNAVNAAYPNRDKTTDGTIGDTAHQATTSDHNPDSDGSVDAWDMDVELNGAGKPYSTDVEHLKQVFQQHESSRYWIHNGKIASRSDGWVRRTYTGSNPHDKHVHWNTRASHESSTAPWPVRREGVAALFCNYGDQGANVSYLQFRLRNLGFDPGPVDGDYGDGTAAALKAAEASLDVTSDGRSYGPASMIRLDGMWVRRFAPQVPGPQGPAGPPGPQGPKGEPGPAGDLTAREVVAEVGALLVNAATQG